MGNQGMTNWKFSAFFAIALMLIAGMFASTAIAADGDGTIGVVYTGDRLAAGSVDNTLTFTYVVPADMADGHFRLEIPQKDSWAVSKKLITITDGGVTIYVTDADGAVNEDADADAGTADSRARVEILPKSGEDVRTVTVKLALAGNLVLTFTKGTAATPRSLDRLDGADANESYQRYKFIASSAKKDGRMTELKAIDEDDSGLIEKDETDAARAYVHVGNVVDGAGTVTITPAVAYEGEERSFTVRFDATGPMYGSTITVTIPPSLYPVPATDTEDTAQSLLEDALRVTGDHDGWMLDSGVVTITVDAMNKNDDVRVSYQNATVGVPDPAGEFFVVQTNTTTGDAADVAGLGVAADPLNGALYQLAGSGTLEITSTTTGTSAVPVNTTHDFAIKYTAASKFENVFIRVALPTGVFTNGVDANSDGVDDGNLETLKTVPHDTETGDDNYGYVSGASGDVKLVVSGLVAVWGPIDFARKGSTFTSGRINNLKTPAAPAVVTLTSHVDVVLADPAAVPPTIDGSPTGAVDPAPRVFVLQTSLLLGTPDIKFDLSMTATGAATERLGDAPREFAAGSQHSMEFTFTAATSPIYEGEVWFEIPRDWDPPEETDKTDVAGRVTATLPDSPEEEGGDEGTERDAVHADDLAVSGRKITVTVKELAVDETVVILYGANAGKRPAVQDTAQDDLEITGHYKVGKGQHFPSRASDTVPIDIANAASGSGSATISAARSNDEVRAGSEGNRITVTFTAEGTMDSGKVRLTLPAAWGPMQSTASDEKNYIDIVTRPTAALEDEIYGNFVATAYLDELGPKNTVTFTLDNAVAQSGLGLAKFIIASDGGDGLEDVVDEAQTDDEAKANEFALGKTYAANPGELRIQVVGGEGGSGGVEVEVVQTDEGLAQYDIPQDDGTVETDIERRIHAGDDAATLKFTYTPTETIKEGELRFTVPRDWSEPQADAPSSDGYTQVREEGTAQVTFPEYLNRNVTVPISFIDSGGTIVIEYGLGNGGAKPPTEKDTHTFTFEVTGSESSKLETVTKQPTVQVYSQAGSKGSASVDPATVTAGEMTTVTITYDPVGEIVSGRARLTVPDAWANVGADLEEDGGVKGAHFTVNEGRPQYGGNMTADQLDDNDDIAANQVLVTGVSLDDDDELTFKYTARVPLTMGDVSFTLEIDGGDGPDEGDFLEVDDSTLTVTVEDAAAGSGSVMISQGKITNDTEDNEITFTYEAIGEIGEGKQITVTVPDTWSSPVTAADMQGTFTTEHYLKPADDAEPDDDPVAGSSLADASVEKVAGAADDDDADAMIMVATVASEASLLIGDTVVFTYTGKSPEMPERSVFTTEYDGMPVDGEDVVIVQSAEGATMLALSSDADSFILDDDGTLTVAVKLVGPDGTSPATSDEATTVTLSADGGTITSSVTIDAGEYEGVATLTADDPGSITINASTTATSIADAEALMVTADTNNVVIDEPIRVSPMYVAASTEGTPVTVMATGTAEQDGKFSVSGGIATEDGLTQEEAGSYTGTFLIFDLITDGIYEVTVSLNGKTSEPATFTVDSTAPTVSASASAEMVADGDTVTISAMAADDGSGVASVMADVSMLDSTQGMVELMMGDDGSYSADVMISERSEGNEADNGTHAVTITATDMAGNSAMSEPVMVTLQNSISFTSMIPAGISLFHVPLDDEKFNTIGDLRTELGDKVNSLVAYHEGRLEPSSDNIPITAGLGIIVLLSDAATVTFTGEPWGDDGTAEISLEAGDANLIGLPLDIEGIDKISDIIGLFGRCLLQGSILT